MKLIKNCIYVGKINTEPVKFTGMKVFENQENLGQQYCFEYVKNVNPFLSGYSQTLEQVSKEQYVTTKASMLLYGDNNG